MTEAATTEQPGNPQESTATAHLHVNNVVKEFPTAHERLRVLDGASFSLSSGDSVVVTGPSGSGKSTLLYVIGGLEPPTSGDVELSTGEADEFAFIWSLSPRKQAAVRNQRIGFVFQDHNLLPQCTVLENVLIPTLPHSGSKEDATAHAQHLLERVGLAERTHHRPAELSGGERQRVAVCRALVNRPALVLADEPTGNLDPKTAETVGTLLLELGQDLKTMLVCVTHSLELAARFPQRLDLQSGKLVPQSLVPQS